jgi:hypothetical protein
VHDGDLVGHRHGLLLVVRDVHEREARPPLDALELELQLAAQAQVEGAERLVEQQGLGTVDQARGERDALLLAAGELGRLALLHAGELRELEDLGRRGGAPRPCRRLRRSSPKATLRWTSRCGNSA